jgi:prepilin signal peptidase PulO-like enzyme (type II secretory pathway)
MSIFIYLLVYFIFGSIIGSFLNVVIWRMPRGQEIGGRSYCPHCHNELRPWHLIPLFSFIFLGGKCAFCRKPVSWRYFIIEFLTGLLFVLAGYG